MLGYFDAVKAARLPDAKEPKITNGLTAKDVTYHDMPEHYTYNVVKGKHIWSLRAQENRFPTIGRMYQAEKCRTVLLKGSSYQKEGNSEF